ncbi:hypothetical protein GJ496_004981 [Pomphorhynchus laevis]|nr:hypothetical protein GJ496_004981 [Pomphorhynchus laevis]
MWHHNEHHNLFREAAIIQSRMEVKSRNYTNNHAEKRWYKDFIKLMTHGKTTSAVRMLSLDGIRNGVHQMDDKLENHMTVRDKLTILHPEAGELNRSLVLSMPLEGVCDHYSEVFQCIDLQMIQSISKTVQGSCGPSAAIIQSRMEVKSRNYTNNHAEKRWYKDFIKLMTHGKTTSAVRMLSLDGIRNGVHQMDDKLENHMTVRDKLTILHPEAGELNRSLVLSMPLEGVCDHYSEKNMYPKYVVKRLIRDHSEKESTMLILPSLAGSISTAIVSSSTCCFNIAGSNRFSIESRRGTMPED